MTKTFNMVVQLANSMGKKGLSHVKPNKLSKESAFHDETIEDVFLDEEGNVFLSIKNSNQVILPRLIVIK